MAMSDQYQLSYAAKKISRTTSDLICDLPGLAYSVNLENIRPEDWVRILIKYPTLSDLCPFDKFYPCHWADLICGQKFFLDRCPWHKLQTADWHYLLGKEKTFLKFLNLEYISSSDDFQEILCRYYSPDTGEPYTGLMSEKEMDPSSYLIYKRMDEVNGKLFLDKQFAEEHWDFLEALYDLAPEEIFDAHNRQFLSFFVTLMAPDSVFEKLFPCFDLSSRDPGGNSLLLPALVYGLCNNAMERYSFLRRKGLDPDEKNSAGFSCNDLNSFVENINKNMKGNKYVR